MTEAAAVLSGVHAEPRQPLGRALRAVVHFIRRKPFGAFGGAIVVLLIVLAAASPVIAQYDPNVSARGGRLKPPSAAHWAGTDNIGRDLFSRLVYGSRVSLEVGTIGGGIGITVGLLFGLVSGYAGGLTDDAMQRLLDILLAFPGLVLALALVAMLGASVRNVIIAVSIGGIPTSARVVRSVVLSAKQQDYVIAARLLGARPRRIVLRHILPNTVAPVIVLATIAFGGAIIAEASLSFLGLGIPPPAPSWGAMLSGPSRRFMTQAPWMAAGPGIAITAVIFGVNIFGDALRDVLDPRLRTL